jgi:hypothetical protein
MSRSCRVDPKYIQKVNLALKRNGYPSQRKFAEDIVPSLSTVKNFLKGKPVDYENFREICERLGLDWQAITYIDVDVEPDEEVAKPYQELVESDAGSNRVTNLKLQQIQFAYGDSDTVLPDDVERPAHWM